MCVQKIDRHKEFAHLIDRMLYDGDPEVQHQAMIALPITLSSGGFDLETQVRPLVTVAFDECRPLRMRRRAAEGALMGTFRNQDLITEAQRAALTDLAKAGN